MVARQELGIEQFLFFDGIADLDGVRKFVGVRVGQLGGRKSGAVNAIPAGPSAVVLRPGLLRLIQPVGPAGRGVRGSRGRAELPVLHGRPVSTATTSFAPPPRDGSIPVASRSP